MNTTNKKILLVEDNQGHAFIVKEILEREGYDIDWVDNAENALIFGRKEKYHIALIDYRLPDMNGIELFKQLKVHKPGYPTIIFTGAGTEEIAVEALKEGIYDYIVKSSNLNYFLTLPLVIKNTIKRFRADEEKIAVRKELENEKKIVEAIIKNLSDGIIFINKNYHFIYLNRAFESIFRIEKERISEEAENILLTNNLNLKELLFSKKNKFLKDELICQVNNQVLKINKISVRDSSNEYIGETIIFKDITKAWEEENNLRKLALTDNLTGSYNRAYLSRFEELLSAAKRYNRFLSIILFDLDNFKKINDTYGHLAGDMVLREVVKIVKNNIRGSDLLIRYGGDEFLIILLETEELLAQEKAQFIQNKVAAFKFFYREKLIRVTLSLGTATYPHPEIKDIDNFIRLADSALYRMKNKGVK